MPRIQIYTTRWCGYCVRAKTLLDSRGLAYEEIALDDDPAFRQTVLDATGGWTVPQILIDGKPIGGYTELWRLDRDRPARRAPRRLTSLCRLAGGTEPGRAAGDLRACDQRPAAVARLVPASVDAELVLHRASAAVGQAVVAERRSLPGEAVLERGADPAVQPPQLVAVEAGGRTQRVEPRAPQRLVDVDVPHPREGALIEERRLQRGAAARETLAEPAQP